MIKSTSVFSNPPSIITVKPSIFNFVTDILLPIATTIISLFLWELIKAIFNQFSEPTIEIYFVDQLVKNSKLRVQMNSAFNLPIYINAKSKVRKIPFINMMVHKKWDLLVNVIADPSLNIYSLGSRTPTNKYIFGQYTAFDNTPCFLGPETYGAGAKIDANGKLPITISVLVYYGSREKPFAMKQLQLVEY